MKAQFILLAAMLYSLTGLAQKPTKEEKAQEKFCKEHTITEVDPFTNKNVVSTKFDEAFGIIINNIRVGINIWLGAKDEEGNVYLLVRLALEGANSNEILEGEIHEFSLYDASSKEIIKLKTSSKTNPAPTTMGNQYGASTVSFYDIKYKFSQEELNSFKNKLFKAMKLNVGGVEVVAQVDNEDRAISFQKAIKCLGK